MALSAIRKARTTFYQRLLAGAGGLVAAALSLGYSLYEARNGGEIMTVSPETVVNAGRWNVTLHSGSIAMQTPDGLKLQDGGKALVVDLTLENLSAESSNLYAEALKLDNIASPPRPYFYLTRDKALLGDLQPMMPENVKAVWQMPADQPLPEALIVSIVGSRYKPKDNLYAAPGWFDPAEVAKATLPLTEGAP